MSLHKYPQRSKFWYCTFYINGKRYQKCTKTTDKKQAQIIHDTWFKTGSGKLSPDEAREIIARGVKDIMDRSGAGLPSNTVKAWVTQWLDSKNVEASGNTLKRYRGVMDRFLAHLGPVVDKDLSQVTSKMVETFRNESAEKLSAASANLELKIIRSCFTAAVARQLITRNPADVNVVKRVKKDAETEKRAFTIEEIRRLYDVADEVWKGIILAALYTGQRLGDVTTFRWRQFNLKAGHFTLGASDKTGRQVIQPIAKPLLRYLSGRTIGGPDAFLFPSVATTKSGTNSNSFHVLMVKAGLVEKRTHQSKGKGRNSGRQTSAISFHSLRHTFVTWLKAGGASNAIAQELTGHASEVVNRSYTHLDTESLRPAIDSLPDVTK